MTPKRTAQSGFFSPRFLTGFAFCAIGVLLALLVFARPNQLVETQNQSVGQQSIPTFVGIKSPEPSSVPAVGTIENMEGDGLIDLAALNIHPTSVPVFLHGSSKAPIPGGAAMSTGKAFLGMTHEVVNQNTTAAFGTLSSGWSPMESVQFYVNGVLAATFAANADGVFAVGISTGAGFGYVTIDHKGLTSGKETGGVVQVAPTGPYLPGVTGAPHAINTTASGHFYLYGWGYPPSTSTTVTLYRNGIFQGFVATNASGRFFATFTPANNGDTSAVYSADTGTTGSMAGVSLEERADAGTPPVGDQNAARVFFDRATLDSAVGGTVSLVGEGFQAGETVTISSCAAGSLPATADGAFNAFLAYAPGAGISQCVLTGGTSGRVARGTVLLHPNVTNLRGLIAAPGFVPAGGTVPILGHKLPPSDTGAIPLDTPTPTPTCPAAQNYNYTVTTGAYLAGTTDAGVHCDDCSAPVPFPFPVKIYDTTYMTALAGSNGELAFGTDFSMLGITCMPVDSATYTIGPLWVDQTTLPSHCATCGVFYATSGTAPNRTFVIEWRNIYFGFPFSPTPTLNYEVIFHEATTLTGTFDVSYNMVSSHTNGTDSALTVGVQKDNTTNFTEVGCDPTGTNPPAGVTAGARFIYTLGTCLSPTPTPTASPTPTATAPPPCGNYITTTGAGTIVPGTTDTGNHCDDCTTPVAFPFPVFLYGSSFNSALVSSNGNLQFTGHTSYFDTSCPLPDVNVGEAVFPYQDDLLTDQTSADCANFAGGCGVFTSTTGTTPNRQFNIEWRAAYVGRSGTANFEVRFYEGSSFFDVFYGATADNGSGEESGVQQSASSSAATTYSCLAPILTNGSKVTYSCAACAPNDYAITTTTCTIVPGTIDSGNPTDAGI